MEEIRKPAALEDVPFEDLFCIQAGRAYIAEQLNGNIEPEKTFKSSRTGADACSYDLFEDGSLWFHSNAQDEVWADATDFINELCFSGLYWEDVEDRDDFLIDDMDKNLLIHLLEDENAARDFFEKAGGVTIV